MANTSPSTADNAFPRLRKGRRLKADGVWRDTRAAAAQKRAFIQAINGGALENGTFVPVDVDPVIPDALDIIGNPLAATPRIWWIQSLAGSLSSTRVRPSR